MKIELLLDEHVPPLIHTVGSRDRDFGAVHVTEVDCLGEGSTDKEILRYAAREGLIIVTNDDDFLGDIPEDTSVLYYPSQTLGARELTEIIASVCGFLDSPDDIHGTTVQLTDEWL